VLEDPGARFDERLRVLVEADTAQSGVAFDRAVDVAVRRGVIAFPRSVRPLCVQQRRDEVVLARVANPEEMHREQPLRLHAVARLEHPDPEAIRRLIAIEPVRGLGDRSIDLLGGILQGSRGSYGHSHRRSGISAARIIAQGRNSAR
jgi:hypothetical protein